MGIRPVPADSASIALLYPFMTSSQVHSLQGKGGGCMPEYPPNIPKLSPQSVAISQIVLIFDVLEAI